MFLSFRTRSLSHRGASLMLAAAAFAAGLTSGQWLGVSPMAPPAVETVRAPQKLPVTAGYSAEVLRVLDGDTFEARVRIWPGQDVTTRVRLRSIDAPEMKARCEDERVRAVAAKDQLARILGEGGVTIRAVGQDKYGGRVDAEAATAQTQDVGRALREAGLVRPYDGGKRRTWCD
jgi:micrococcal nuclease